MYRLPVPPGVETTVVWPTTVTDSAERTSRGLDVPTVVSPLVVSHVRLIDTAPNVDDVVLPVVVLSIR